jgi:glucokinase
MQHFCVRQITHRLSEGDPALNKTEARSNRQQVSPLVIGVEFGHANITGALINERARVLARRRIETPKRTTRAAVESIANLILGVASAKERENGLISAVGISVPGLIDPPTERVTIPDLKGWTRVALRQLVEKGLSDSGHDIRTPINERRARAQHSTSSHPLISIHSQVACLTASESWSGSAKGKKNVVYIFLDEEIKVGILADGRILQGSSGEAGAASWLSLSENFKQEYGARGCLATEAGAGSLARRAIEGWSGGLSSLLSSLIKADPTQLDAPTIIRAARGGDALALQVINETCSWIGRGIANLISVLNPDVVVIGGELGSSLQPFLDEIREVVRLWASPAALKQCRIVNAALGENAGVLGAAHLARQRQENA